MTFVVPTVCQYTIHGTYASRPVANVLSYHVDTTGSTVSRTDAVKGLAEVILNSWDTRFLAIINSAYSAQSVSWLDLNSATGDIGSITSSPTKTWPKAGLALNASMPGNVAILVRKNVSAQRGARKGRMFLCGVDETATQNPEPDKLYTANLTQFQTAATGFYTDTKLSGGGPTSYDASMVVVHITSREPVPPDAKPGTVGNPLTGVGLVVSSLTVDPLLATQRRRLRG